MYFTLGALTTLLFTELAKYTIGRLRPHYLSLCGPRLTSELYHDEFGNLKFVMEPEEELCENHKIRGPAIISLRKLEFQFLLRDISHHLPLGQSQLKIYECSSALPPVRDGDPELLGESHEDQ